MRQQIALHEAYPSGRPIPSKWTAKDLEAAYQRWAGGLGGWAWWVGGWMGGWMSLDTRGGWVAGMGELGDTSGGCGRAGGRVGAWAPPVS